MQYRRRGTNGTDGLVGATGVGVSVSNGGEIGREVPNTNSGESSFEMCSRNAERHGAVGMTGPEVDIVRRRARRRG